MKNYHVVKTSNPSTGEHNAIHSSTAPNWDNVPFDVGCARCGEDLRGLHEPICPACGLEFDWADAVPIEQLTCLHCGYHLYGLRETRCPECGESFSWEEVLAEYHRHRIPLFEYQWRRRPVRSFVGTWLRALRPGKFWRSIDIHDPPQVSPLIVMVAVGLMFFTLWVPMFYGVNTWLYTGLWVPGVGWTAPSVGKLPADVLRRVLDPSAYTPLLVVATWCATSFVALMIFRQSMRLCKVRTVHVLRVWAYGVPLMLPLAMVAVSVLLWGTTVSMGIWLSEVIIPMIPLVFLAHVIWSLDRGYKHYLRMPHSSAVAGASQIVALLGAATILLGIPYLLFGW